MVLRVAAQLAQDRDIGSPAADVEKGLARLANEAEVVHEFQGKDLDAKFKQHVVALPEQMVRGRTVSQIVESDDVRKKLYGEIDAEIAGLKPVQVKDAAALERELKNALTTKLGK
jgi:hypothetical protein